MKISLILLLCFLLLTGANAVEIGNGTVVRSVGLNSRMTAYPVGYNVSNLTISSSQINFTNISYQNLSLDLFQYNATFPWNGTGWKLITYDFPCLINGTCGSGHFIGILGEEVDLIPIYFMAAILIIFKVFI
jgi:hypothetical protein